MAEIELVVSHIRLQLKFAVSRENYDKLTPEDKVVARYPGDNLCYLNVSLPNHTRKILSEPYRTLCRDAATEVTPIIIASEFGNFNSNEVYGVAQTVCGYSGKPLIPFAYRNEPNADHATFAVPHAGMLCRATHHVDNRWSLALYDVKFNFEPESSALTLDVVPIWIGTRFTECRRRYMTALAFAMAKAMTPYCADPVFYVARGPAEELQCEPMQQV